MENQTGLPIKQIFKMTTTKTILRVFILIFVLHLQGCTENSKPALIASKVIPFFQHWNLILGDGSNAGVAIDYENKDFFYATNDGEVRKSGLFSKRPTLGTHTVLQTIQELS